MFHFASPWMLLLLAVPALLLWRRGRGAAVPHPDLRLLEGLSGGTSWPARHGMFTLHILTLVMLAVALAGPRWPDLRTRLDTDGIALMMAVDVSGSMAERDFVWEDEAVSRLEAVQRLFSLFVAGGRAGETRFEGRAADLVGLVRFATRPEVACPLTLQHRTLLGMLEAEQPRATPGEGETNISDALALALSRLKAAGPRRKVLVLLTDGEHNVVAPASGWTPRQAAQVAASLGVAVHAIDAGSDDLKPGESPAARANAVETLKDIAQITGGEYLPASDTRALAAALRRIDRLERSTITSFQYRRYHEGYPWFGLASFVLFVLAEVLGRTVWRRLP